MERNRGRDHSGGGDGLAVREMWPEHTCLALQTRGRGVSALPRKDVECAK